MRMQYLWASEPILDGNGDPIRDANDEVMYDSGWRWVDAIGLTISELYPLVDPALRSIISADGGTTKRANEEIVTLALAHADLNRSTMCGSAEGGIVFYPYLTTPVAAPATVLTRACRHLGATYTPPTGPDQFTITDQTGVELSTMITSASVTVTGCTVSVAISVTGLAYRLNGAGSFVTTPGIWSPGDTVEVQRLSDDDYEQPTSGSLNINGVSDTFTVTTKSDSVNFDGFETLYGTFENASTPLTIPTYDGSGECVHPSVVYFQDGWHGFKYWMAMTPHPSADYENPSIVVSNDGVTWSVPAGLTNPVIPAPATGHNYDPSLFYDSVSDQLWMYYGESLDETTQRYKRVTSSDGVTWSAPTLIWTFTDPTTRLSPSITKKDSTYYAFFSSNSVNLHVMTSSDGVTWSAETLVPLGNSTWHADVQYITSISKFLIISSSTTGDGFLLSTSVDGLSVSRLPLNLINSHPSVWDVVLYKASGVYHPDTGDYRVFYSAKTSDSGVFRIGATPESMPIANVLDYNGWEYLDGSGEFVITDAVASGGSRALLFAPSSESLLMSHDLTLRNNVAVEWDFYDDNDATKNINLAIHDESLYRIGIGVDTSISATHYVIGEKNSVGAASSVARSLGWHTFAIQLFENGTAKFLIDDVVVATATLQFSNALSYRITGAGGSSSAYFDNIKESAVTDPANSGLMTPPATFLLRETFEAPGYTETGWTGSAILNSFDISPAPLHERYSARLLAQDAITSKSLAATGKVTIEALLLIVVLPNGGTQTFFSLKNSAIATIGQAYVNTNNTVTIAHGTSTAVTTMTLSAGTAYRVWMDYTPSSGGNNGIANIFITPWTGVEGKPASPAASITNGSQTSQLDKIRIANAGTGIAGPIIVDEVRVYAG